METPYLINTRQCSGLPDAPGLAALISLALLGDTLIRLFWPFAGDHQRSALHSVKDFLT